MSARWRKVIGDLQESPARTLLVAIAILIGVLAVSATFGTSAILSREITSSFQGTHPAAATLWFDSVDRTLPALVQTRPGVTDAEARRMVRSRAEVSPGEWLPLRLFGVEDFQNLRVSIFHPHSGDSRPLDGELLIEQSALPILRVKQGDRLRVRVPSGTVAELRVSGIVHDPGLAPGWMDQIGYAYTTPETLARLGEGRHLDELRITIDGRNRDQVSRTAADLADWLTEQGHPVQRVEVPPTGKHPHADQMAAMLTLLRIFSVFALALSGVLAANVMTALLAKQVRQVGIMKAIGATTAQVSGIYLGLILILTVAAVVIGIPTGAIVARTFARFASGQLNLEVASWAIPPWIFGLEVLLGLGIPLLAAAIPVVGATRKTAREAIQHIGLQMPSRKYRGWRWLQFSDRAIVLSLRNTFRRPLRLWLTLGALAIGGALLITSVNVYQSLVLAVDKGLDARGDDIEVRLYRPAPSGELVDRVRQIPGVTAAEAWGMTLAAIEMPDIRSDQIVGTGRYNLFAPPANTTLLRLPIIEGRSLEPNEDGAVVVNRHLQDREPSLQVGSTIALRAGEKKTPVRVLGVVEELGEPALYTTSRTLDQVIGMTGRAAALRIVVDSKMQTPLTATLEQVLVDAGWFPTLVMTHESLRRALDDHFLILLIILATAALSAVVVGGLGKARPA